MIWFFLLCVLCSVIMGFIAGGIGAYVMEKVFWRMSDSDIRETEFHEPTDKSPWWLKERHENH